MSFAVDTNVLLDVLLPNPAHAETSQKLLEDSLQKGALLIGEVVYGELAVEFPTADELDQFLSDTGIRLINTGKDGLKRASEAWSSYLEKRGTAIQCQVCGQEQTVSCSECGEVIQVRQHMLSDFLVAGHALEHADKLITRDLGFYRSYFEDLTILSP